VPNRLVTDSDLIAALTGLFRSTGFDAASVADISKATGLRKSSLYHRFPAGKQQMAAAVVEAVGRQFIDDVLAPLAGAGSADERVRAVGRRLRSFYDSGDSSCVLEVMSVGAPDTGVAAALSAAAAAWIGAFAALARSTGASASAATARSQDAVAAIEGALVLARVTGDRRPFERAIRRLPVLLIQADPHDASTEKP
jgi:TetR/AcrR family transcriptional repressor of lmrAB and yxaGH operons